MLARLAEFTEASVKLRQKIQGAMMYPVIMVGLGGLILTGMFVFVVPQITQIFADTGQELRSWTRLLIGFQPAGYATGGGSPACCFVFTIYMFRRWKKTPTGSRSWDLRKLGFPIFGKLFLMIGVSRFTKTLSTLLTSGVPLLTALDITKNVLGNQVLMEIIEETRLAVKEGANLASTLKNSGRFPPMVVHMNRHR